LVGGWQLQLAAGLLAALVGCGSSKEAPILPGPSSAGSFATGGSGTNTGGGSAPAQAGSAGSSGCPDYAPNQCPGPAADQLVCVSLLSDPEDCGKCGAACEPQATCDQGLCSTPPKELTKAEKCGDLRLALAGSQLFWTERQSGRVRAMPVAGGTVTEVASGQLSPNRLSVDGSGVYWVDAGDGTSGSSKLMKAALPLGDPPVTLRTAPGTDAFIGVAVDNGRVYFGLGHDVHAISTDASDATDVIVGVAFARNDTRMPDGVPEGLTVHDGRVYWVVSDVGSVESDDLLPGSDGLPRVGHSGQLWPNDLGFAGGYVYYAAFASLYAAQTDMPAIAVASSLDDSELAAFAVSETDGYFADVGGHISRHALALPAAPDFQPTPSRALARDQGKITSVVLDATHLYWASVDETSADCAIRALPL
jgi:hypothetical protein